MEKYVSEVKIIEAPQERVFNRLSNLENLGELFDPARLENLKKQYPEVPDIKLENFASTPDECSFTINLIGKVGVRIIEREPFKQVKLEGTQAIPFPFNIWLQLLPLDDFSCKMKITLHAELSVMIKMMVDKHLKEGINKLADGLTKIPF